jgi:S-DNA-T family DNA segregation ATPase FtsK/SpoIIIE
MDTIYLVGYLLLAVLATVLVTRPGRHGFAIAGWWSWSRWRRYRWAARIRSTWRDTVRTAGLSRRYSRRQRVNDRQELVEQYEDPSLEKIRTSRHAVTLTVRTRPGQTVAELEAAGPRLAATYGAAAYRVYPDAKHAGSTVCFDLVMRDLLREPVTAKVPADTIETVAVRLGRRQDGRPFRLQLRERQTLVVGCAGAGKGSFLWGICCGLAPAVRADVARLYGVDLKGGVELAMGEALFTRTAYDADAAVQLLQDLDKIAEERMQAMRGHSRWFEPSPGDPLHVLVIDELASLTAYAPTAVKKAAEPVLSAILSKGRAVGVLVVAFVQDPRKEIVGMRGLFTQTVGLRLRSAEEVTMTLGEGMAAVAPAHRILKGAQGTAWVIAEDGSTDRVRADYWPDDVIRQVADTFPAARNQPIPEEVTENV